jgi:hypothetical protein
MHNVLNDEIERMCVKHIYKNKSGVGHGEFAAMEALISLKPLT